MDTNNNDSTINFIQANDCIIIRVPGRGITMVQRWNKTAFNQLNELIVKKDVEKLTELLDQLKKGIVIDKALQDLASKSVIIKDALEMRGDRITLFGFEMNEEETRNFLTQINVKADDFIGSPYYNFLVRLSKNPFENGKYSVVQYVLRSGLRPLPDGRIVAFKGISSTYWSINGNPAVVPILGRTDSAGRIYNGVGETIKIKPEDCEMSLEMCANKGLHVGTKSYATSWGQVVATVFVPPEAIACVPNDTCCKVRCVEYFVFNHEAIDISEKSGEMEVDGYEDEDEDDDDNGWDDDDDDEREMDQEERIAELEAKLNALAGNRVAHKPVDECNSCEFINDPARLCKHIGNSLRRRFHNCTRIQVMELEDEYPDTCPLVIIDAAREAGYQVVLDTDDLYCSVISR